MNTQTARSNSLSIVKTMTFLSLLIFLLLAHNLVSSAHVKGPASRWSVSVENNNTLHQIRSEASFAWAKSSDLLQKFKAGIAANPGH